MDIDAGQVNCIIGPNGSGKSTALKAINGLIPIWDGTVTMFGDDMTHASPREIVEFGIITVPQGGRVFADMSVRENLRLGAYLEDDDEFLSERYRYVYDMFPILKERESQLAGSMSGGQQAMLALGRALMSDPEFLLLDEPSAGLAPNLIDDVFDHLTTLKDAGVNMLLIEQNVRKVLNIAEYIYILDNGHVRFEGGKDELTDEDDLVEMYLGRRST
ncbi:ABC transporter ATP-binding protein (plasmid) [Natronosalvus rutilus]|uniref:ABC transporter ATP-binding protein n=2 Tax=Natronosalvus rutilus TaxID=2953753 RepID=A0A9E7SVA6_9EURY|nr:ABC transporter ATP-binding protein [Natronosalvus rutilus]UTF55659.1 ABC transporter ATP-binding protein [Natronosalvus rutilus]